MSKTVLIVDDEKSIRFAFSQALEIEGYETLEASDCRSAISLYTKMLPDAVLLDVKMPDGTGLEVLKQLNQLGLQPTVIMMTAFGDISLAVEAMKLGAFDFRTKPLDISEIKVCIQNAIMSKNNIKELQSYRNAEKTKFSIQNMIGESPAIKHIQDLIKKVSVSLSTSVLIQGPSGTGKELVARAIHYNSSRSTNRFIEVNCTAIPESLLESELFGHEKGSFTDAKKDHKGIFEQAHEGTLFLDEIGDMPLNMQAKLLRALQEKRFKRIGGVKDIHVDVRVIASTNVDLLQAVKSGKFREDLLYRLKVVPINMPPLKERGNDSILIATHYLKFYNKEFKKDFIGFSTEAETALKTYDWPGNIRELKNIIERAVLLETGKFILPNFLGLSTSDTSTNIQIDTFPNSERAYTSEEQTTNSLSPTDREIPDKSSLLNLPVNNYNFEEVEKSLLETVLRIHDWNRNAVAKEIGINRTTLYAKIKKYGLEKPILSP